MNKKRAIIIVIILVAVLAVIAAVITRVLPLSRLGGKPNGTEFADTTAADNLTAGQILTFLDNSTRDERGAYNTFYNCSFGEDGEPVCDNGTSSNRTGMAVMWANYAYFQATDDKAAMDRLARDIALYANRDEVNIIQTDDLSCFYLEPIVHSNHPAVDREVARKICLDTEYEISLTGDGRYNFTTDTLEAHRDNANGLIASVTGEKPLAEQPTATAEYSVIVDGLWATWATDHAARYLLDNEHDTLIDAYFFFAGALTEYRQNRDVQADFNRSCELLLASSQMCKLTGVTGKNGENDETENKNENDPNCRFTVWLDNKLADVSIADSSPEIEAVAKCVLADTENRDRYISFIKDYYNSPQNEYYQFEQIKLLNEYGGLTKSVVSNALFAGLTAKR